MDLVLCLRFFVIRDSWKAGIFNPDKVVFYRKKNLLLGCCRFVLATWRKERHRVYKNLNKWRHEVLMNGELNFTDCLVSFFLTWWDWKKSITSFRKDSTLNLLEKYQWNLCRKKWKIIYEDLQSDTKKFQMNYKVKLN